MPVFAVTSQARKQAATSPGAGTVCISVVRGMSLIGPPPPATAAPRETAHTGEPGSSDAAPISTMPHPVRTLPQRIMRPGERGKGRLPTITLPAKLLSP